MTNSGKPKRRSPPAIKVIVPNRSSRAKKPLPAQANLPTDALPVVNARIAPTPASPVMIEPEPVTEGETLAAPSHKWRWRFPTSLRFWAVAALTTTLGIGGLSIALLLKLPALPNCPSIFWPTASARLRFYCADLAANKQTVDDLLEAIKLINSLPADHPLRPEINRQIETWATDILNLAEAAFNNGKLDEAIATARRIPANTSAHSLVEDRIKKWQDIWQKADSLYQGAQNALKAQDLQKAFTLAVQLLDVENEYWRTTKYRELNGLIAMYREDGNKLGRARSLIDRGGKENLLEAVKLIEEIKSNSPLYAEADKVMAELGQKMLDFASAALDRQDWEGALDVLRQIPERAKLQAQVQDFRDLAEAQRQAWGGTVADLEAAIVQAQRLAPDRPLYDRAQSLIGRWRLEIEAVGYLERARQLAEPGGLGDLTSAISEASMVRQGNPRRAEARRLIADWSQRVEDMQDRPRLDQAEQLAIPGDMASLQAAIAEASQIRPGRTLYPQARERIRDWTSQIQTMQDRPILDRARQLALSGNLPEAIQTVESIASGRALSREAQTDLRDWRAQIQGQTQLQQAYQAASSNTIAGLVSSIRIASQVSANSSARAEADRLIDASSQALLQTAQAQAQTDLAGAIDTAENIPSRSSVYGSAQSLIQEWRSRQVPVSPSIPSF
ncbi:chromosome segregation ATPase [Microcoleus sp. FACHB-1515]|uniref:chromosome segregation ATPase n=1 Tax=Cyanophyceae TaxID=3028117 RepID=UPI001687E2C5|nr:chromosome segregation ATPase [Microcoleus sp. FACHB-1515]MBD2090295.1 chromosome segregation ATPase [Microcoleus sp. FACHB-1515]